MTKQPSRPSARTARELQYVPHWPELVKSRGKVSGSHFVEAILRRGRR